MYVYYVCVYVCLYVLVLTLPLYYEQVGRARYATNGSREVRIIEPKLKLYGTCRHTHTQLCAKIQRVLNYSVRMEGRLSTAQRGNRKMEASIRSKTHKYMHACLHTYIYRTRYDVEI
jgi:hypothetical protein